MRVYTIWFYLYKTLENKNYSIVAESISVLACGGQGGRAYKGHKSLLGDGYVHCLDCGK